jgi:hypothetical protein
MLSPKDYFKRLDEELISSTFSLKTYFDSPDNDNDNLIKGHCKFEASVSPFSLPKLEKDRVEEYTREATRGANQFKLRSFTKCFLIKRTSLFVGFFTITAILGITISNMASRNEETAPTRALLFLEALTFIPYALFHKIWPLHALFTVCRICFRLLSLRALLSSDLSFDIFAKDWLFMVCFMWPIIEWITIQRAFVFAQSHKLIKPILLSFGTVLAFQITMLTVTALLFTWCFELDNIHQAIRGASTFGLELLISSCFYSSMAVFRVFFVYHNMRPLSGLRIQGVQPSLLIYPELLLEFTMINKLLLWNFLRAFEFLRYKKQTVLMKVVQVRLAKCIMKSLDSMNSPSKKVVNKSSQFEFLVNLKEKCFRDDDEFVREGNDYVEMQAKIKLFMIK